jgi:hypothetical protein
METITCTNCGTPRADQFCPHCGQNSRNYQRSLPPMLWELLRETFDLDSRLARTLPALLFKPGELALEFSRNRRASYVSPLRLYLFVSLTFFFLVSTGVDIDPNFAENVVVADGTTEGQPPSGTDTLMAQLSPSQQEKARQILERPDGSMQKKILQGLAEELEKDPEDPGAIGRFLIGRIVDAVDDPGTAINTLMDNLPVAMFVALPVFAALLKLIYLNKHRYYVEHLVFATHLHSFAFIVYGLLWALPEGQAGPAGALWGTVGALLPVLLFVYHFAALKRYYRDGYVATFFKYQAQMILYLIVLTPIAMLVLLLATLLMV